MADTLNKLSPRLVASLRAPGLYSDGGNLYLHIGKSGTGSWRFIYRHGGKQREAGLGSTAKVSLAAARQKAAEFRAVLGEGKDPLAEKKAAEAAEAARAVTFGTFADEYVKQHRPGWSNPKHADQWAMTLGPAYCAAIRDKPVGEIGVNDILAVLGPVWQSRPETARRVRMRLEKVLDAARVRGLRTDANPATWRGNLDHLLPKHRSKVEAHHAAMPFAEVPAFMASIKDRDAVAALALRLTILTAARTSEVLLAEWSEFDIEARLWTIPAGRMKARRQHRVPLSDAALAVLDAVKNHHPTFVFPSPSGKKPLSNMALLSLLKRMERQDVTVHGFRSSFRDWCAECTTYPGEVAEMALAHAVANQTEAAYRRGDLFDKRRELMAAWAAYVTGPAAGGNVLPFKASGQ